MDIQHTITIGAILYKIASLLVGLASCYFGYKLFVAGIWGNAGDMETNFGNNKVVLKSAAPGTFFAVLGTIIICVTIWKGLELNQYSSSAEDGTSSSIGTSLPNLENGNSETNLPIELPEDLPE